MLIIFNELKLNTKDPKSTKLVSLLKAQSEQLRFKLVNILFNNHNHTSNQKMMADGLTMLTQLHTLEFSLITDQNNPEEPTLIADALRQQSQLKFLTIRYVFFSKKDNHTPNSKTLDLTPIFNNISQNSQLKTLNMHGASLCSATNFLHLVNVIVKLENLDNLHYEFNSPDLDAIINTIFARNKQISKIKKFISEFNLQNANSKEALSHIKTELDKLYSIAEQIEQACKKANYNISQHLIYNCYYKQKFYFSLLLGDFKTADNAAEKMSHLPFDLLIPYCKNNDPTPCISALIKAESIYFEDSLGDSFNDSTGIFFKLIIERNKQIGKINELIPLLNPQNSDANNAIAILTIETELDQLYTITEEIEQACQSLNYNIDQDLIYHSYYRLKYFLAFAVGDDFNSNLAAHHMSTTGLPANQMIPFCNEQNPYIFAKVLRYLAERINNADAMFELLAILMQSKLSENVLNQNDRYFLLKQIAPYADPKQQNPNAQDLIKLIEAPIDIDLNQTIKPLKQQIEILADKIDSHYEDVTKESGYDMSSKTDIQTNKSTDRPETEQKTTQESPQDGQVPKVL